MLLGVGNIAVCEQNKGKARSRTGTLEASLEASQKKKSKKGSGFSNSIQKKQEGKKKGGEGDSRGWGGYQTEQALKKIGGGFPGTQLTEEQPRGEL